MQEGSVGVPLAINPSPQPKSSFPNFRSFCLRAIYALLRLWFNIGLAT